VLELAQKIASDLNRMIHLTVILCTYNRCLSLPQALDSIAAQALPDLIDYQVLVVDNNSTDQTGKVVDEYCRRYPGRFRYIFEQRQGLSNARNAGIREAEGEIVAFMDDDVAVDPTWLDSLTRKLHESTYVGAGGRIFSDPHFSPPSWLGMQSEYNMGGPLYAHFDMGDKPKELQYPPHGTNMAYRKEMFEKHGGFRTDLGRSGNNTMSNEDTEFGRRLLNAGERLWYEPSAVVHHPVPQNRLRKDYFLKWWFDYGRASVREGGFWWIDYGPEAVREGGPRAENGDSLSRFFGILKFLTLVFCVRVARWVLASNSKHRFYRKCRLWMSAGKIREFCRLVFEPAQSITNAPTI
jgi:glycosyltransferase involved in cell wall biosynthesis